MKQELQSHPLVRNETVGTRKGLAAFLVISGLNKGIVPVVAYKKIMAAMGVNNAATHKTLKFVRSVFNTTRHGEEEYIHLPEINLTKELFESVYRLSHGSSKESVKALFNALPHHYSTPVVRNQEQDQNRDMARLARSSEIHMQALFELRDETEVELDELEKALFEMIHETKNRVFSKISSDAYKHNLSIRDYNIKDVWAEAEATLDVAAQYNQ